MPDPTAAPSSAVEVPPDTDPAIRTIAMPADTNPHGDIFGGWLLCQMDLAGGTVAVRRAGGRVVTVAITAMAFHRPVCVGDQVSCYGSVENIGTIAVGVAKAGADILVAHMGLTTGGTIGAETAPARSNPCPR